MRIIITAYQMQLGTTKRQPSFGLHTSKIEGVASALQLIGIEGRWELPGNVWVNSLVGIYHLSPKDLGSSLRSNLQEQVLCDVSHPSYQHSHASHVLDKHVLITA